ncbi:MAG: WD40 repeat domain-containing protein [Polaribacter sp.]|uniref:hypothetical protein n=1 Tax=Polaribacter sp. TaxID=1920175 RepID=UPI003BB03111
MRNYRITLFLMLATTLGVNAQETIVNGSFTIRDFFEEQDSIFYIEKRDVKYFNKNEQDLAFEEYFIGGYGLKIFNNYNEIVSISNEFEQNVSSVRFFNKKEKEVKEVFYYKQGKSIDALLIPEKKYVLISTNDKKITVIDFGDKPAFKIVQEISLNSLARSIYYHNKNLYYATDLGEIYQFNFRTQKSELIHSCKEKITNLNFYNDGLIFTTIQGKIVFLGLDFKASTIVKIKNNFILNTTIDKDNLVCGTFKGEILVVSLKNREITNQLNYHNRSVLSITKGIENYFYSSGIDKTLKKWKLE